MPDGILQRFPDLASLTQLGATAGDRINTLLSTFGSLSHEGEDSPVATVTTVLEELGDKLNIDASGLSTQLPSTIDVIRNALPADTLEFVESIQDAYTAAQDFLQDSALVKEVREGSSLQDVALAVIQDALNLFDSRLTQLSGNLIDPEMLGQVRSAFASVEEFRTNFPTHRDEFLPFITQNLTGVSPGLLSDALAHVNSSFAVLAPIEPDTLTAALDPVRQAISNAFIGLATALQSLDPADANGYAQIQTRLNEAEAAINAMRDGLAPLYEQLQGQIDSHAWDDIFSTHQSLLEAISLGNIFSVDEVVDTIASALEDLLARIHMVLSIDDLVQHFQVLRQAIRDTFINSALGQIRQTLLDFLEQIHQAIEDVPTEQVQATVERMLTQVGQELNDLGIDQISDNLEQAFAEAETFITDNIDQTLRTTVRTAVAQLLSNVQDLSIADLISELTSAVVELETLIGEIETALEDHMNDLTNFVAQLDELSFKPLSDEVIQEIDDLKQRLESINPNALSDVERVAIKGALAVLEAIDLESQVVVALKEGFDQAESGVKSLLNQLTAILEQLRANLDDFSPETLLEPLNDPMEQVLRHLDRLNGRVLLNPLYTQVDQYIEGLEEVAPGRLLDPLQAPYASMMGVVNRLDPQQWVAPLDALYAQIDQLIALVDITPLFDELDRRQRELFNNVRDAILSALDSLDLPEPLSTFFDSLRPVLEGITEGIFGDPDNELKRIGLDLGTRVKLTTLFEPLDTVFDRLLAMVEAVPQDDLTETINTVRQTVGVGLDILAPKAVVGRFRNGQSRLAELAPNIMLVAPLGLPAFKQTFQARVEAAPPERQEDVLAVSARFDAVFTLVDPDQAESHINQLIQAHNNVMNALRLRINSLDASGAGEAYASLRGDLDRLLPDFLRGVEPLTHADIIAGFDSLRPSAKARKVELVLERFLQQLVPLQEALEPVINELFQSMREVLMLINPLSLKDAVADIYDTIRAKVRVLDPEALAEAIRENFFQPLTEPLEAINPQNIKARIDEAFSRVLTAVSTNVKSILDDIVAVIDEELVQIRQAVRSLITTIKNAIETASDTLKRLMDRLEALVFVELLERLKRTVDNLGVSFDKEVDRVSTAFNGMLAAIPV